MAGTDWHVDMERKKAQLAFLLSLGLCANLLELFIPAVPFLPWLKPGLANAFTLAAIYLTGPASGILLALLRSLISAIFTGVPVTSLLIGGIGGLLSATGMGLLVRLSRSRPFFSPIGISVAGALLHTSAQLIVVYFLFIKSAYLFWQLPVMGPFAAATGVLTGWLAVKTIRFLESRTATLSPRPLPLDETRTRPPFLKGFLLLLLSILLLAADGLRFQLFSALILISVLSLSGRRNCRPSLFLRFIPLAAVTLLLNAFTEPGHYLSLFPWVTWEGLEKGTMLTLRLLNLIALSLSLLRREELLIWLAFCGKRWAVLSEACDVGQRAIRVLPETVAVLVRFAKGSADKKGFGKFRYFKMNIEKMMGEILEKS